MKNNKVEAYGLLLGHKIVKEKKINDVVVFGDSSLTIHEMISKTLPKNVGLNQILKRAQKIENHIANIDYYHIMRKNNKKADEQENEGVNRSIGHAKTGDTLSQIPIP